MDKFSTEESLSLPCFVRGIGRVDTSADGLNRGRSIKLLGAEALYDVSECRSTVAVREVGHPRISQSTSA